MRLIGCHETVTIVRHVQEQNADRWSCEVLVGVSWFSKVGSNPGPNGETPRAEFIVRIPAELVTEPLPKDGDYIVRGAIGTYTGRRDLKDLEYFQISYVGDNRRTKMLPHVVVRG